MAPNPAFTGPTRSTGYYAGYSGTSCILFVSYTDYPYEKRSRR
ncbi:hypothetical protein B1R32_11190 [Abditibacterium utsteinense]|uniref:Uncharacterized protein n=1 Tax=Abditibacterium utsteinense TaxID=1960156 RepID=A0A2S8SS12_9BACT|nr:hypothetical protein B1R32_11190 [Abditibacterium utsteinense]